MSTECCVVGGPGTPVCICAHEDTLALIGKKWAALMLRLLQETGPAGYNELFRHIAGITPKAFGEKLRLLEEAGLVERMVRSDKPRRVDYVLTGAGEQLLPRLEPFFATPSEG